MTEPYLNAFERALAAVPVEVPGTPEGGAAPGIGSEARTLAEWHNMLAEAMTVRRKIDSFLGGAEKIQEIAALLLTVITAGNMFGYNRAFLLLSENNGGTVKGRFGIGTLSKEETWREWELILREELELERIIRRAMEEFEIQQQRLSPLLDNLEFPADTPGPVGEALRGPGPEVLYAVSANGDYRLFDLLGTGEVGVIPMWGAGGRFGAILVDNFASGTPIVLARMELLDSFAKPFVSALERALTLERYRQRVAELQEANARIEAQQEMLIRMERKNTLGRYSAVLAHNLLNPILSMTGHLGRLGKEIGGAGEAALIAEDLRQDVKDLERFLEDFVAQVEEQSPDRHYWDLNHLVNEAVGDYRSFHPLLPPSRIRFSEGVVSLVMLDYGKVRGALARVLGIMDVLGGGLEGLSISSAPAEGGPRLVFTLPEGRFEPASDGGREGIKELERIAAYLAGERIVLFWSTGVVTMDFMV